MEQHLDSFLSKAYRSFKTFSLYTSDSLLLVLITYGKGTAYLNGIRTAMKRGTLCFITPFDSVLLEADSGIDLQGWFVRFSLDFMLDFISDPFIDPFTYQVLREKNGIAQLGDDERIDISHLIEKLKPEPGPVDLADYLGNRNVLRLLFALANDSIAGSNPSIGRINQ